MLGEVLRVPTGSEGGSPAVDTASSLTQFKLENGVARTKVGDVLLDSGAHEQSGHHVVRYREEFPTPRDSRLDFYNSDSLPPVVLWAQMSSADPLAHVSFIELAYLWNLENLSMRITVLKDWASRYNIPLGPDTSGRFDPRIDFDFIVSFLSHNRPIPGGGSQTTLEAHSFQYATLKGTHTKTFRIPQFGK